MHASREGKGKTEVGERNETFNSAAASKCAHASQESQKKANLVVDPSRDWPDENNHVILIEVLIASLCVGCT